MSRGAGREHEGPAPPLALVPQAAPTGLAAPAPRARDGDRVDVAVIGAGPYGLAATAGLRALRGCDVHLLGEPMSFWRSMPAGMLLRSPWQASHIADPERARTLDRYRAAVDPALDPAAPIPLEVFLAYGRWFQHAVAPDVDRRRVEHLARAGTGFRVRLEDGSELAADRVVVAAGIGGFPFVPPVFRALPPPLALHTAEYASLGAVAGRRFLVVGGGQSALECAALAREAGADVQLVVRAPAIRFLRRSAALHRLGPLTRALYASSDVGPAGLSHLVARPHVFRTLPRPLQDRLARRSIRPAGSAWLQARLAGVQLVLGREIVAVKTAGEGLAARLDDGLLLAADRVLLGTGWRVDVARYAFLDAALLAGIEQVDGYPVLDRSFSSSLRGLHFVGVPAAWSFGPLMRFVAGTRPTVRALAAAIAQRGRSRW